MDLDGNERISFYEFMHFYYLIPTETIRQSFDLWTKSAIDIGESVTVGEETKPGTSPWVTLFSGGVAGACSRTATAPLDRLKVIMQANTKGDMTILGGLKNIYKEGGTKAFFRGNGTNVIKIIPETAIKFLMYDAIKAKVCKNPKKPVTTERLISGACAGFIS
jgi:solute carrier family 25 phosphate transporter 23/24/25/41